MKKVVIFGGGDQGRTACVYLTRDSPYEVAAFTAHGQYVAGDTLLGFDVVPFERVEERYPPESCAMFVAIGYARANRARAEAFRDAKRKGYQLVSYISSRVSTWGEVEFGENCFVLDHTAIQPFARIGHDVVIGLNCAIGHDVRIGDHCFIGPGAAIAGNVVIGPYCLIGANATINHSVTIGPSCTVGAGALISNDTREGGVHIAGNTKAAPITNDTLSQVLAAATSRRHRF